MHINFEADQISSQLGKSFEITLSVVILENYVLALSIAEFMELSPEQQERIGRIVNETLSVMSLLHDNRGSKSPEAAAAMGMQTLQASWRQIQMELTPQQQAKWRALTAS